MNDDLRQPDPPRSSREPTELIVAPTRIGGRRRFSQPGIVAAIAVIAFVGIAVWNPWNGGSSARPPSARTTQAPIATGQGGVAGGSPALVDLGGPLPNPLAPFPSKATLLQATNHEPRWGIRAMVVREGPPEYPGEPAVVERFVAAPDADVAPPAAPGALSADPISVPLTISQMTDEVAAIGLTTADGALALDVRIWRLTDGQPAERLAPFGIVGPEPSSWLWLPDPMHVTAHGMWPAGTYEIDALLGPRIVRLVATIPASAPEVVRIAAPTARQALAAALAPLESGLVVLIDGGAVNVVGGQPPVADERSAWLGPAAGLPSPARVESLDLTGFGWIAGPGEQLSSIDVRLIAPTSPVIVMSTVLLSAGSERGAIVAQPDFVSSLPGGLYEVTTSIIGPSGPRTEVDTVEVVPSGLQSPPLSPLDAMGRWIGLLDQPDNHARQPLIFIADAAGGTSECSPSTTITGSDTLLGIVVPRGVSLRQLRILPEGVIQSADIAIRFAPDAIPRLTVVALPSTGLPIRDYDLFPTLESAAGETRIAQRFCVTGP